ncbi:MAG: hypothetical protein M1837_001810 [Sclerophora amabilis]|nr:MAG: hypothetical protein M1837_001810 [Sclerophora amabilis]
MATWLDGRPSPYRNMKNEMYIKAPYSKILDCIERGSKGIEAGGRLKSAMSENLECSAPSERGWDLQYILSIIRDAHSEPMWGTSKAPVAVDRVRMSKGSGWSALKESRRCVPDQNSVLLPNGITGIDKRLDLAQDFKLLSQVVREHMSNEAQKLIEDLREGGVPTHTGENINLSRPGDEHESGSRRNCSVQRQKDQIPWDIHEMLLKNTRDECEEALDALRNEAETQAHKADCVKAILQNRVKKEVLAVQELTKRNQTLETQHQMELKRLQQSHASVLEQLVSEMGEKDDTIGTLRIHNRRLLEVNIDLHRRAGECEHERASLERVIDANAAEKGMLSSTLMEQMHANSAISEKFDALLSQRTAVLEIQAKHCPPNELLEAFSKHLGFVTGQNTMLMDKVSDFEVRNTMLCKEKEILLDQTKSLNCEVAETSRERTELKIKMLQYERERVRRGVALEEAEQASMETKQDLEQVNNRLKDCEEKAKSLERQNARILISRESNPILLDDIFKERQERLDEMVGRLQETEQAVAQERNEHVRVLDRLRRLER